MCNAYVIVIPFRKLKYRAFLCHMIGACSAIGQPKNDTKGPFFFAGFFLSALCAIGSLVDYKLFAFHSPREREREREKGYIRIRDIPLVVLRINRR